MQWGSLGIDVKSMFGFAFNAELELLFLGNLSLGTESQSATLLLLHHSTKLKLTKNRQYKHHYGINLRCLSTRDHSVAHE